MKKILFFILLILAQIGFSQTQDEPLAEMTLAEIFKAMYEKPVEQYLQAKNIDVIVKDRQMVIKDPAAIITYDYTYKMAYVLKSLDTYTKMNKTSMKAMGIDYLTYSAWRRSQDRASEYQFKISMPALYLDSFFNKSDIEQKESLFEFSQDLGGIDSQLNKIWRTNQFDTAYFINWQMDEKTVRAFPISPYIVREWYQKGQIKLDSAIWEQWQSGSSQIPHVWYDFDSWQELLKENQESSQAAIGHDFLERWLKKNQVSATTHTVRTWIKNEPWGEIQFLEMPKTHLDPVQFGTLNLLPND